MTIIPPDPDVEPRFPGLRPLDFRRLEPPPSARGELAYEATIEDDDAPGAPVYSLTVTADFPAGDQIATRALEEFLKEIKATFFLNAPGPDGPAPAEDPQPEDFKGSIMIEPRLVDLRTLSDAVVGVTLVMTARIEGDLPEQPHEYSAAAVAQPDAAPNLVAREVVLAGKNHWYYARVPMTATATAYTGNGTISPGPKNLTQNGGPQSVRGTTVVVHGNKRMEYLFVGQFSGPH